MNNNKKKVYQKWWFWLLIIILTLGVTSAVYTSIKFVEAKMVNYLMARQEQIAEEEQRQKEEEQRQKEEEQKRQEKNTEQVGAVAISMWLTKNSHLSAEEIYDILTADIGENTIKDDIYRQLVEKNGEDAKITKVFGKKYSDEIAQYGIDHRNGEPML